MTEKVVFYGFIWQTQLHFERGKFTLFHTEADSLQSAIRQSEYFLISLIMKLNVFTLSSSGKLYLPDLGFFRLGDFFGGNIGAIFSRQFGKKGPVVKKLFLIE